MTCTKASRELKYRLRNWISTPRRSTTMTYDYYDVHQFQSCQDDEAESVHAQWSDHVLVWREDPYILLLGKNWPKLKG